MVVEGVLLSFQRVCMVMDGGDFSGSLREVNLSSTSVMRLENRGRAVSFGNSLVR